MAASKGAALLSEFESLVEGAEAFKASTKDSPERKIKSTGSAFLSATEDYEGSDAIRVAVQEFLDGVKGAVDFDRTEGDALATTIENLIGVAEDYRPTGFDADNASDLISRWKGATKRGGRGSGNSTTPESQRLPVPVKVTFTYPENADITLSASITHESTWSSVSAEITKRAMILEGKERGEDYTRPDTAKMAWRSAVASIKDGGDGGTVVVPTSAGDLIAEVAAVR